jgi:hypothetical protein
MITKARQTNLRAYNFLIRTSYIVSVAKRANTGYNQFGITLLELQGAKFRKEPAMSDQFLGKVTSDLDPFKKILSYIPGFKGYMERQSRRDADKLLRETVADRFEQQWGRISALQREFISSGDIAYVDDLEAAAIKLRTFADRVRRATRGYSGLFDAVKINEEELGKLYEYDATMLGLADEVGRAVDNVEASVGSEGLPAALRNLKTVTQQCIDVFDRREEAILGSGQPQA